MQRYSATIKFDTELEDYEIEDAVNDFLEDVEAADYEEEASVYFTVEEDYPNFDEIEEDD